jgi:hypothetical protein
MHTMAIFFKKIKADKWNQLLFTLMVSLIIGVTAFILPPSANLGRIVNSFIYFIVSFFLVYVFVAGYVTNVDSALPNTLSKKFVSMKALMGWMILLVGWLAIGGLLVISVQSAILAIYWVYSTVLIMTIYPCLASLAIYFQSYRYLRKENNEIEQKKQFVKSLTIITIGLASPWLLLYSSF